jgi:hypothetical protein
MPPPQAESRCAALAEGIGHESAHPFEHAFGIGRGELRIAVGTHFAMRTPRTKFSQLIDTFRKFGAIDIWIR